jgi:hypothetical protein
MHTYEKPPDNPRMHDASILNIQLSLVPNFGLVSYWRSSWHPLPESKLYFSQPSDQGAQRLECHKEQHEFYACVRAQLRRKYQL